ncbi:MAG: aspartyl-tRNA(Asn)/glutamyl-tRNA(Gln) amidotransferase subunit A, partial [Limisphaerales bacterium]
MLNQLTISQLREKLSSGEASSREVTQSCLERIASVDDKINAFISHNAEDALAQADTADAARKSGDG